MQDKTPDSLIAAFERHYDTTWDTPSLRNERLAWKACWEEATKPCLVQIQEPAPHPSHIEQPLGMVLNALLQSEAALEVAIARILKADPGHSISVTSEAKALVAVRSALGTAPVLAAQPATNHSETPNSSTITVPRGWKLVPDDATPEWIANLESSPVWSEAVGECIKKFLAAAPSAPQAAPAAVAVPDAVRDALLQSEAALEVATARILKADPDHSISVTSEAKALVAVRAALAATPAATAQARGGELNQFLSAAKDAGITHLPMSFGEALRELEAATGTVVLPESDEQVKELMVLIGKYGSAVEANSTGNPSNYTLASDESAAYEAIKAKLRALLATGGQAQADKEMQLAMQEASSLAQSIFKRHYSDDEHYASGSVVWGLCDSLRGVISQIDNMTSGLVRAPQAQADARDAEQERWMEIGKAIERACIDQPDSTEIVISLERDAGTVTMFDPDGNEHDQFSHEDGFAGVVNAAIEAAIAAAKGE